jgi:hypothetical protein
MVSIKGIFCKESNQELDELIKKPICLLDGSGGTARSFSKEGQLSLYSLTM